MAQIDLIDICIQFGKGRKPASLESGSPGTAQARDQTFSIENLTLTIPDGCIMAVLGPSGCGKTTLLKIIAGLIKPASGEVRYGGVDMKKTPPGERKIGMVFQNYALYPHYTSRENILSYFRFRKRTPELDQEAREKFQRTSELMGVDLSHLLNRMPDSLSGGERQRVAIARCITRDPALFLLDEPFANLDQQLREKYRVRLKVLLQQFHITTVYVTHDQQEARILADLIALMDKGKIVQVGTYAHIYGYPQNVFVAEFLNLEVETPAINLIEGGVVSEQFEGMIVGARPEDIALVEEEGENCIPGRVAYSLPLPFKDVTVLCATAANREVYARIPFDESLSRGRHIWLALRCFHVFQKDAGLRVGTHGAQR